MDRCETRRIALQLASQLPDDQQAALEVVDDLRDVVLAVFLPARSKLKHRMQQNTD